MKKVEMTEDWQERGSQRREFMEDLVSASYRRETEVGDKTFHLGLASVIVKYLKDRQKGIIKPEIRLGNLGAFFASVLIPVRNFSRTKEEEDVLIAQFLEKVLAIGVKHFHEALTSQEIHEIEKIFHFPHVPSVM